MGRQNDAAKLLAIGLLNYADDDGYFHADPKLVRNAIRPFDDDSGIVTVAIRDLSEIGFLEVRQHPTHGPIGFIPGFSEHQVINKHKQSKIKALFDSGNDTGTIRDEGGPEWIRDQGSRNGSRNEGSPPNPQGGALALDPNPPKKPRARKATKSERTKAIAESLWAQFPAMSRNRSSLRQLEDEVARAGIDQGQIEEAAANIAAWSKSEQWTKDGGLFAPAAHRAIKYGKHLSPPESTVQEVIHYREKPTIIDANDPELIRRMEEAERNGEIEEIPF